MAVEPCQNGSDVEDPDNPKLLRAVAKKQDIVSMKSLFAACNATQEENERVVVLGWLCEYGEESDDCFIPKHVLEYAELVKVACVSEKGAEVLRNLVYGLGSLIRRGGFIDENVADAL